MITDKWHMEYEYGILPITKIRMLIASTYWDDSYPNCPIEENVKAMINGRFVHSSLFTGYVLISKISETLICGISSGE